MILDPLLTVPIYVHKAPETKFHKADLCYEVRGHSNAIYNLVSDRCVAVIGEFVHMPSPWQHLNTLGAVGMVAIGGCHNTGHCMSLAVSDNGDCVATINNHPVLTSYHQYGISVTKSPGNVKIKVSHCEYVDLTMWVMYRKIDGLNMMKYVVTRGLNMHPTSHGLIGEYAHVYTLYVLLGLCGCVYMFVYTVCLHSVHYMFTPSLVYMLVRKLYCT